KALPQADAQRMAEQELLRKKFAESDVWTVTVQQVLTNGIVVHGFKGPVQQAEGSSSGRRGRGQPHPTHAPDVDIFLVGHPNNAPFARGSQIQVHALRDGVETVDGRTLEKWVYCEPPSSDN
ncbi:MAG TPA: hypothetical protein VLZ30_01875, partial [Verrucomicrobiae bacterium]|nr:hypothetical protein [Verrucomicrobiae bacterium]